MSLNNINNNASVVNVGRTVPVTPGPQIAAKSIPVVISTDQESVPVEEQNKIQSEVALSLLGIPRAEVALGIFADVNTYDVNPSEWSSDPEQFTYIEPSERSEYADMPGRQGWGTQHLPEESGALVEAPANETSVLTSKRFFRYQPGRVSSATFGIKSTSQPGSVVGSAARPPIKNPPLRKYGIFDKFDGYYWETRDTSQSDQFCVVRRTQSLLRYSALPFGDSSGQQTEDLALAGKPPDAEIAPINEYPRAIDLIERNRFDLIENSATNTDPKCFRDLDFVIDAYINDLKYGGDGHVSVNATTYRTALLLGSNDEVTQHTNLRDNIEALLTSNNQYEAANRINTLSSIQIDAVGGTQPDTSAIDWGQKPKITTIFDIYDKYLGYLVSQSMGYDTSDPVRNFSPEEYEDFLKFKCLRDVKFVVQSYSSDLQYGGNAATIYNAKKYYANGELQIYSQTNSGTPAEIDRHTYLQELLTSTSDVTVTRSDDSTVNIDSVSTLFGFNQRKRDKLIDLSNIIINNFSNEYQGLIDYGQAEQFGDVCILRDGLLMTHAALYDASLLKQREKALAKTNPADDTITTSGRSVIISQYVVYYGDAGGLEDGKMYYVHDVRGPKENILSLVDPMDGDFPGTKNIVDITSEGTENYIETPVPFIFPPDYDGTYTGGETQYDGMFPYAYSLSGVLPADSNDSVLGRIDTAIDVSTNAAKLREQIDLLNLEYKSWVRDHVDPTYYSVYEYRVPRSRFSGDSLDGTTRRAVYADNVLDKKAGENFIEDGVAVNQTSVWDFDFSKVTMLKVEFSWYGAVGALFLAYVPVGNGEARWVRVHHLRASNQLKISSLGNATLPITYLVYGGGTTNRMGPNNAERLPSSYSTYSENLVKYGASYYIDGGDRGTVRLYNHSSDTPTEIYGSRYSFNINNDEGSNPYNPSVQVTSLNGAPDLSTFYINSKIITGNSQDQNVRVIWIDPGANRIYLNKSISTVSSFAVISDRPSLVYGIKTKEAITSGEEVDVRNRVQVYPTRLSIGTSGTASGKFTLLKTPIFQTTTNTQGLLTVTDDVDLKETELLSVDNTEYLNENGDETWGYLQAYIGNSTSFTGLLGKLSKKNDQLFFTPNEIYNSSIVVKQGSEFLKEGVFDPEGQEIPMVENSFEKERLSSVEVTQRASTPIPGTGTELASYYTGNGAQEFDLATYFDYNKEYISFPLTDQLETLFLSTFSNAQQSSTPIMSVSASLTWEEQ